MKEILFSTFRTRYLYVVPIRHTVNNEWSVYCKEHRSKYLQD